jgi:hypothetical protein
MRTESRVIIDWIKARTDRLRLLAADLVESRQAFVQLDLDEIYQHNLQQQALCREIERLDAPLIGSVTAGASPAGGRTMSLDGLASGWDEQTRETLGALLKEHEAARGQVCEISRVQADLLRRSRRYLQVLANLVTSSMGYYEAPGDQSYLPSMRSI